MADPLSAIASVVGIAAAAASLANTVYKFSDNISNARIQMYDVASEMIQLSNILNSLDNVLRQGLGTYKPQILIDTKSILDRVWKIQEEIRKIVKRNRGLRARVKWALSSGKVAELLDRIEALKSSLGIVLATVQLAMAYKEPQKPDVEIQRLKELVLAGVREIRQSMVTLQQARPALMFEPQKMLTDRSSGHDHSSRGMPRTDTIQGHGVAVHNQRRTKTTSPSRIDHTWRHLSPVTTHKEEAVEPGRPQFETAAWLYQLTLANALGSDEDVAPESNKSATENSDGTITPYADRAPTNRGPLSMAKLPSPQRLNATSVLAVARRIVENWTFLVSVDVLPTDNNSEYHVTEEDADMEIPSSASSADISEASDTSYDEDEDEAWDTVPPRRRFTFQEYDLALESGDIHDTSYITQNPSGERLQSSQGPGFFGQSFRARSPEPFEPPPARPEDSVPHPFDSTLPPHSPPPFQPTSPLKSKDGTEYDSLLNRLQRLLLSHYDEEAKLADKERRKAENARFDRIESILISQQETKLAKEKAKAQAAAELAARTVETRNRDEGERLARLEQLLISQREEQIERDVAAEATRKAEIEAARLQAQKERQEGEAANALVNAAVQARKQTEKIAAEEAEKANKAHEEAMLEAHRAVKDMEDTIEEERRLRQRAERMQDGSIIKNQKKFHFAAGNIVDSVYGKEEKKWYMTANGPLCIDTSDGSFARQTLIKAQQEDQEAEEAAYTVPSRDTTCLDLEHQRYSTCEIAKVPQAAEMLQVPDKYHLVFRHGTVQAPLQDNNMIAALRSEGIEALLELDTVLSRNAIPTASLDPCRREADIFVHSSLLWQSLQLNGQSELYQSLCKCGWKPTYMRSSVSGQTWFHGSRPVHVRFESPSYIPRFTDFDSDISHECVIVGSDIVDEDALRLTGVEYKALQNGTWMLEAGLTYEDISALVSTSFMLRETSLRRVARQAMKTSTSRLQSGTAGSLPLNHQLKACIDPAANGIADSTPSRLDLP